MNCGWKWTAVEVESLRAAAPPPQPAAPHTPPFAAAASSEQQHCSRSPSLPSPIPRWRPRGIRGGQFDWRTSMGVPVPVPGLGVAAHLQRFACGNKSARRGRGGGNSRHRDTRVAHASIWHELRACVRACLPACLLACLPACLLACLPARPLARLPDSPHVLGAHLPPTRPAPDGLDSSRGLICCSSSRSRVRFDCAAAALLQA
jgi:hypothetical protein